MNTAVLSSRQVPHTEVHPSAEIHASSSPSSAAFRTLVNWLLMVRFHAKSGSTETLDTLEQLAKTAPSETDSLPVAVQQHIATIKSIAQSHIYDPKLLGIATTALYEISGQSPMPMTITFRDV